MSRYVVLILVSIFLSGYITKNASFFRNNLSESTNKNESTDKAAVTDSIQVAGEPIIDTTLLQIEFCGDQVPLKDLHVARRYQNAVKHFSHRNYLQYKKRAAADLKVISKILKQHHLPVDLKYIPMVESNFDPVAISPKGAVGYWQLMPQTAIALGLRVDDIVDERTDLVKSTHAAAKYLKWLYGELGNWTLAVAAYNSGPAKLIRQMDAQKKNNFYHLRLNNETSKYVYKIVAVKELFNNAERSNAWLDENFLASLSAYHNSINKALIPKTTSVAQIN